MLNEFLVGDHVDVYRDGKKIRSAYVIEITPGRNIRINQSDILYRPDGTERRRTTYWAGRTNIEKCR